MPCRATHSRARSADMCGSGVGVAGSARWRNGVADRSEAPSELREHLHEVRAEPLIDDLPVIIEPECQHQRRLRTSPGWLLYEQPRSTLSAAHIEKHDHHVTLGNNPLHVRFEVGKRAYEPATRTEHGRIRRKRFECCGVMA